VLTSWAPSAFAFLAQWRRAVVRPLRPCYWFAVRACSSLRALQWQALVKELAAASWRRGGAFTCMQVADGWRLAPSTVQSQRVWQE